LLRVLESLPGRINRMKEMDAEKRTVTESI